MDLIPASVEIPFGSRLMPELRISFPICMTDADLYRNGSCVMKESMNGGQISTNMLLYLSMINTV